MIVFAYTMVGLLLVVLQSTVFMLDPLWPGAPDLYFILVAYLAYRVDLLRSMIILFPVSWALDAFSGVVLGTYPAICFLALFLLKIMDARMPVRESLYQVPLIGVGYLVVSKFVYTAVSFLEPGSLAQWSWGLMLVRVILLVLFAWPMLLIFESINKRLQKNFVPFKMLRVRTGNRYRPQKDKQ